MKTRRLFGFGNPQLVSEFTSLWESIRRAAEEDGDARFRLLQCDQLTVGGVRFRGIDGDVEIVNPGSTAGGSSHNRVHALASTLDHSGTLASSQHSSNLDGSHYVHVQLGGQVGGSVTSPDVRGIRETSGPTLLLVGAVADGEYMRRSGSGIVSGAPAVPSGVICMWSGLLANIPAGWALCDGTAGTPDLRDKFIVGAASGQNPGSTGGASTHTHATHASGGAHTHDSHTLGAPYAPDGGGQPVTGASAHSSDGGHTHNAHDSPSHLPPYYSVAYIMKI